MSISTTLITILSAASCAYAARTTPFLNHTVDAGYFQIDAFNVYSGYFQGDENETNAIPYSVIGFHVRDPSVSTPSSWPPMSPDSECLIAASSPDTTMPAVDFESCGGEPLDPLNGVSFGLEVSDDGWFLSVERTYVDTGAYNGTMVTDSGMLWLVENVTVVPDGEGHNVTRVQVPPEYNVTEYLDCAAWFDIPYNRVIHFPRMNGTISRRMA